MKLKINHKKKFGKVTDTWRLKNILLKNEWANHQLKRKFKSIWKSMKMITPQPKTLGRSKGGHKRKVYSNTGLPKKGIKISDTQSNLTP